jgi:hypothetical protein
MTNENKNEQKELMTFDLDNENDVKELNDNILNNGDFFKIEEGITYKIELTSTKISQVEKTFMDLETGEDKISMKYVLQIKSINSEKEKFEGDWEVGIGILNSIVKNHSKDAIFKVTRTGQGKKTKYAVVKDF